jgi:DNA-binding MarR family transcriptional regulator
MILEKSLNSVFMLHSAMEHQLFKAFMKKYEVPDGLNHTHVKTIMVLNFMEKAPMSRISHHVNLEKGSFTTVADKLIKLGYMMNERSEKDRRVYELSLLPKGKALAEDLMQKHREYIATLFAKLDEDQLKAFSEAVELVTDTIVAVGEEEDWRNCKTQENK